MSAARLSPDSKPFCEIYKDGVETIHHEAQGKTKRLDKIYEFMKKAIMIIRPRRYITVQGDLNFWLSWRGCGPSCLDEPLRLTQKSAGQAGKFRLTRQTHFAGQGNLKKDNFRDQRYTSRNCGN